MKWDAMIDLVKKQIEEMTSVGTTMDFDDDIGDALVDALAVEALTDASEGTASIDAMGHVGCGACMGGAKTIKLLHF